MGLTELIASYLTALSWNNPRHNQGIDYNADFDVRAVLFPQRSHSCIEPRGNDENRKCSSVSY